MKKIKMILMLFAVILVGISFFPQVGYAAYSIYAPVVIKNSGKANSKEKAEEMIKYIKIIRKYNKLNAAKLPILVFDLANSKDVKSCKRMGIYKGMDPLISIARIRTSDLAILSPRHVKSGAIAQVKYPLKAAEAIMKKIAKKNRYKNFRCPLPTYAHITSEPPGAEIYIDDKPESIGKTNKRKVRFKPGQHKIVVKLEGCLDGVKQPKIEYGSRGKIHFDLEPDKGNLNVITEPRKAEVYIDNFQNPLGKSPIMETDYPAGPHRLVARMDRYLPTYRNIHVKGGGMTNVKVDLKPYKVYLKVKGHRTHYSYKTTELRNKTWVTVTRTVDRNIDTEILEKRIRNFLSGIDSYKLVRDPKESDFLILYDAWPTTKEDRSNVIGLLRAYDSKNIKDGYHLFKEKDKIPTPFFSLGSSNVIYMKRAEGIFKDKLFEKMSREVDDHFFRLAQKTAEKQVSRVGSKVSGRTEPSSSESLREGVTRFLNCLSKRDSKTLWNSLCGKVQREHIKDIKRKYIEEKNKRITDDQARTVISLDYADKILRTEQRKLEDSLDVYPDEIRNLKIFVLKEKGIHALVMLTNPKNGKEENYQFINEEGKWKLAPKDRSMFE